MLSAGAVMSFLCYYNLSISSCYPCAGALTSFPCYYNFSTFGLQTKKIYLIKQALVLLKLIKTNIYRISWHNATAHNFWKNPDFDILCQNHLSSLWRNLKSFEIVFGKDWIFSKSAEVKVTVPIFSITSRKVGFQDLR